MPRHARDLHRALDVGFLEAMARDGPIAVDDGDRIPDLARPRRFRRKDLQMSDGTLIRAARLWLKKSSRNGKDYLVGRWGGCRIVILENDRREGEDGNTHWLLLGQAEDRPRQAEKAQ